MKTETNEKNYAYEQAAAQMGSITQMVSALNLDWDRLEELQEERRAWLEENPGSFIEPNDPRNSGRWAMAFPDEADELSDLFEAAGEYKSREEAEEAIQNDPLSVEVRSDWCAPGETMTAGEFKILLCTGGPAVQIRGELDGYRQPCRAWLEYQDWFTPWAEYHGENADQETLLAYCQQFYFGE